jgi:hypothetical protein
MLYACTGLVACTDQHAVFRPSCHHILAQIHHAALAVLLGHSHMSMASTQVPVLVLLGLLEITVIY